MLLRESTDPEVVAELGRRVAEHRVALDLTQTQLADAAGVARSTVQRIEGGESIQLVSLVKLLRALGRLDGLDALLMPDTYSPIAALEQQRGRRQRVRHPGAPKNDSELK